MRQTRSLRGRIAACEKRLDWIALCIGTKMRAGRPTAHLRGRYKRINKVVVGLMDRHFHNHMPLSTKAMRRISALFKQTRRELERPAS